MIPNLAIIITIYVCWRILDALLQGEKRHPNKTARAIMIMAGILAMIFTGSR